MAMVAIRGQKGAAISGLPKFTYTGTYSLLDDGDKNWRIKFLTSGTFTPAKDMTIDAFCVGGGGGGYQWNSYTCGSGGGGGYTATYSSIVLEAGVAYAIVIGAGGAAKGRGGTSYFLASAYGAAGGYTGSAFIGGNGGSGGGGTSNQSAAGGKGGSNGANGSAGSQGAGGTGQGTSTREFGEENGALYAGGGAGYNSAVGVSAGGAGGGGNSISAGTPNTGGGGGYVNAGGSGVVVIRNHREAA